MSTRSCIARLTSKPGKKIHFKGVYHHWDGHPYSLGKTLFDAYKGHFKSDENAMLKYLIDEHPAGWSTINRADFNVPAGYSDTPYAHSDKLSEEELAKAQEIYEKTPKCFCHGNRHEEGWVITEKNASGSGCEYIYAFSGKTMVILSSFCKDGNKMIGAFGCGDPKAKWKVIGEVNLEGNEPDWKSITNQEKETIEV